MPPLPLAGKRAADSLKQFKEMPAIDRYEWCGWVGRLKKGVWTCNWKEGTGHSGADVYVVNPTGADSCELLRARELSLGLLASDTTKTARFTPGLPIFVRQKR